MMIRVLSLKKHVQLFIIKQWFKKNGNEKHNVVSVMPEYLPVNKEMVSAANILIYMINNPTCDYG